MHTTTLRKVGGSVMMAVPRSMLQMLELMPGATVGLAVEGGRLLVEPRPRHRYALKELLAQRAECCPQDEDASWTNGAPQGRELI